MIFFTLNSGKKRKKMSYRLQSRLLLTLVCSRRASRLQRRRANFSSVVQVLVASLLMHTKASERARAHACCSRVPRVGLLVETRCFYEPKKKFVDARATRNFTRSPLRQMERADCRPTVAGERAKRPVAPIRQRARAGELLAAPTTTTTTTRSAARARITVATMTAAFFVSRRQARARDRSAAVVVAASAAAVAAAAAAAAVVAADTNKNSHQKRPPTEALKRRHWRKEATVATAKNERRTPAVTRF